MRQRREGTQLVRRIFAFILVTLDGYYEGPDGEFDWPVVDAEFEEFGIRQLDAADTLMFGRRTYEGMAAYWPSKQAEAENDPRVVEQLNGYPKLVVSRTLPGAGWPPTRVVRDLGELAGVEGEIAVLGSPQLTGGLIRAGLLDELRIMVAPVVLGAGRSLFAGYGERIPLRLLRTRTFDSGNVLHTYAPGR
jgi:dihydrofolate reductase